MISHMRRGGAQISLEILFLRVLSELSFRAGFLQEFLYKVNRTWSRLNQVLMACLTLGKGFVGMRRKKYVIECRIILPPGVRSRLFCSAHQTRAALKSTRRCLSVCIYRNRTEQAGVVSDDRAPQIKDRIESYLGLNPGEGLSSSKDKFGTLAIWVHTYQPTPESITLPGAAYNVHMLASRQKHQG